MRRSFIVCLFLYIPSLFALYSGNPSAPLLIEEGLFFSKDNWLSIKLGSERDWVFHKTMSRSVDTFSSISDQGVLLINFLNFVQLSTSVGAARFHLAHIPVQGVRSEYQTHNQLMWGVGLRSVIYSWEKVTLGGEIKYGRAHPTLRLMAVNGMPAYLVEKAKLHFHEWQIGCGASYQVGIFFPYILVKYGKTKTLLDHLPPTSLLTTSQLTLKNRRKIGMGLGCSLSNLNRFALTVEVRLIDEQAISLAGEVKF